MDCETFERIVLDRVFLELDELTMGAAQRHVAHCSRCRTIEVVLRATRDVCRLPQVSPMEGFSESVIAFEKQIHAVLPFRQRVSRAVSVLASYTMRPQPTMAVLLLLMIGASLFLVRARPAERDLVQVTERGVPEVEMDQPENKNGVRANAPGTTNSMATPALDPSSDVTPSVGQAENAQRGDKCTAPCKGHGSDSTDAGNSATNAPNDATRIDGATFGKTSESSLSESKIVTKELDTARAIRKASGCSAAIAPFEAIRRKNPSSDAGQAATWEAAECYYRTNRMTDARALFESLTGASKYSKRAKAQLKAMQSR